MKKTASFIAALAVLSHCLTLPARGQDAEPPTTASAEAPADGPTSEQIAEMLNRVLAANGKSPGVAAGVLKGDVVTASAAAGLRKKDADAPLTIDDKLHLGSCTKAMTATLVGMLIDEEKLSLDMTLAEALPEVEMHADFRDVTIHDLLTHQSGMPGDLSPRFPRDMRDAENDHARRRMAVARALGAAPRYEPRSRVSYSNLGYITLGFIIEEKTGDTWENVMRKRLFEPLGMTSAGFGPPAVDGSTDQPWGHSTSFLFGTKPSSADNPSFYGPAGTVHCSLSDWAKFIALHLGHQPPGQELLSQQTLDLLHTPVEGTEYAAGWLILERNWSNGKVFTHDGSNTFWYATVWIAPERDMALLAITNAGNGGLCHDVIGELIGMCKEQSP